MYIRLFTELRYPAQIAIYENKTNIINSFYPSIYKHWSIRKRSLKLHDSEEIKDSNEELLIEYKRTVFEVENPSSKDYFINKFTKIKKPLLKNLNVNNFTRIGVRGIMCLNDELDFTEIIKKSHNGLLFDPNLINAINPDFGYDDFSITLASKNKKVLFGIMKEDEDNPHLNDFKFQEDLKKTLKGAFSFYDIDCFKTNVPKNKAELTIKKLYKEVKKYPKLINQYLRGTK